MKIGIGIDTGGTCTDVVAYNFENESIIAYGKTLTTKEDLSIGIGKALDKLPRECVEQAEVIALSTTLATNACVENKGGRAKLVLFGIEKETVSKVGENYGLTMDDSLYFIGSKTKPTGKIVEAPDWDAFEEKLNENFESCDAVGIVEMYAKKTGAQFEKKAHKMIKDSLNIPSVCGYELFSENNIVKRGASAMLNARLIPVIEEFLSSVEKALAERKIEAPFVIVRSDGSLMTEKFTATRPVETLLCGPVASVMGAVQLSREENAMIIDMGGTTTDIAFVKEGTPQRVKTGVRIGKWDTFVKGLFVDTFGLGGDSGVIINDGKLMLENEKVMPLCIAAKKYPELVNYLDKENQSRALHRNQQKDIYLGLKDISERSGYSHQEKEIAANLYHNPMSLAALGKKMETIILLSQIERMVREGVLIRCGVTPTDVMHIRGDFIKYNRDAAQCGVNIMARTLGVTPDDLCEAIYDAVKQKLYFNIVRIMIEDAFPEIRETGLGTQLESIIHNNYIRAKEGSGHTEFFGCRLSTPSALIGVGAPTHIFLEDVAEMLGTKAYASEHSKVANALGAIIGKVSATVNIDLSYNQETDDYVVYGGGERQFFKDLEQGKAFARALAEEKAREEALNRGADENLTLNSKDEEMVTETEFGPLYMGYKVSATASGNLKLR
ncbi:hydantoinase/oxoprolinase family protein [Acetobacterium wieringae]|uniref:Acetophenone carboxylase gamma subunit n=1 Tax=Acetobacterium wieringae TaxID=52694 RepID=A0A1F2PJM5_9FIRM|nr:hydantoinase/oxoprolinase family protein [Acetobacterium wieringae]OFV71052.1 acetophenone carboxylase gamma subunit [Acetobacterium wieringae]